MLIKAVLGGLALLIAIPVLALIVVFARNTPPDAMDSPCIQQSIKQRAGYGTNWSWRHFGFVCTLRLPDGRVERFVYR